MTPGRSRLAGLVAAAVVAASGLVGLSSAPASAAFCSGSGVNVVVDFQGLGGGVQKFCDPKGAGRAAKDVFPAAGVSLRYATNQPGFVCRVKGVPESDPCVNTSPANATWGLYWSDGRSGSWAYATKGVGGLTVPNGGFLAFSWQNGNPADPPGVAPVNRQPTPTKPATKAPTPKPTKPTRTPKTPKPTKAATAAATATQGSTTTSASPLAKASVPTTPSASTAASPSVSTSESAAPSETLEPTPDISGTQKVDSSFTPKEDHAGLPAWIPVSVILALALLAFGGLWWRNRSSP